MKEIHTQAELKKGLVDKAPFTFANGLDSKKALDLKKQPEELGNNVSVPGFKIEDKSAYEGDWIKGIRTGYGRITYTDGIYYDGRIQDAMKVMGGEPTLISTQYGDEIMARRLLDKVIFSLEKTFIPKTFPILKAFCIVRILRVLCVVIKN